jgi:adenosylcobinamide kinase / adenosylcobinamide-phosphate guanylyltransferase
VDLILVTGGARSGKSRYAERIAATLGGDDVTYLATGESGDDEMARRIRRHRESRPAAWRTVEAPRQAGEALGLVTSAVVLLDCITLLASNALLGAAEAGEEAAIDAVLAEVAALLESASQRTGTLVVVTNEVGFGVVPPSALGRWYRDAVGIANQRLAEAADRVVLVVAGLPLAIKGSLPVR